MHLPHAAGLTSCLLPVLAFAVVGQDQEHLQQEPWVQRQRAHLSKFNCVVYTIQYLRHDRTRAF
jgi:hypothetical protein